MINSITAQADSILAEVQRRVVMEANERFIALHDAHLRYLLELGLELKPSRVLEIGLGWGYSASAIQSLGCVERHIILELDKWSPRSAQAEANVRSFVTDQSKLQILWVDSTTALPQLCQKREIFDFILIDGGHRYDDVFVDFHFARRLVAPKAIVMFDDMWMPSIRTVVSFIETNLADQWQPLKISGGYSFAVFQRTEISDRREWTHFVPFQVAAPAAK
jgi:predicted O-methyltransferase YrrM